MDFITNLIKRPISLVLNETSTPLDKHPISVSLPNAPASELANKEDLATSPPPPPPPPTHESQKLTNLHQHTSSNSKQRSLSLSSSSFNSDNMSDYFGVPEDFLDEFKDILPPPPPQHSENLNPLLDMDNLSIAPPPPPLVLHLDRRGEESSPTPSMKVSQTIDELLLHINDNLQQAGLNDEVMSIAAPSNKSELNAALSSKTSLNNNNSKLLPSSSSSAASNTLQLNTSKTSTAAAGSATAIFLENEQNQEQQQQHAAKNELNSSSGVNKLSNKFVGLTEFDEAKIPELPVDLNPNIEEEYNSVTFEECFIPTLNARQATTTISDELKVDKTHFLLPNETDCISSDNETFADCCDDERDPLNNTFAEPASLDVTTDLESYESAINKSLLNNTMESIADITMEAEDNNPLKICNQIQVVEQSSQNKQSPFERMNDDDAMDIDMNATLEIIQKTSNNLEHVEKVLQHAEDILQHFAVNNTDKPPGSGLLEKPKESSKVVCTVNTPLECAVNNSQHVDIEQSKHEVSLNKSIELLVNNSKTLSSECIIENVAEKENNEFEHIKNEFEHNLNTTNDRINSSTLSNSSAKSNATDSNFETKLNSTSSLSTSINSMKSSTSSGTPSFPIKSAESTGFPQSPKAMDGKPTKSIFLEKSDYMANVETKVVENGSDNNISNGCSADLSASCSVTNNLNGKSLENASTFVENGKAGGSFEVHNSMPKGSKEQEANAVQLRDKRNTFRIDIPNENKTAEENCLTFTYKSDDENSSPALMQFPSDKRRTFSIIDTMNLPNESSLADLNSRRTFTVVQEELIANSTEEKETGLNTSFEPMDVDDSISQNINIALPLSIDVEQMPQTQFSPLPDNLLMTQENLQSPTKLSESQSSPLPTLQLKPQSPPLPVALPNSHSPTVPDMQPKSQSPPPLPPRCARTQSSTALPILTQNNLEIQQSSESLPDSTSQQAVNIKEEQISSSPPSFAVQPLRALIQKRPPIRHGRDRTADILSAKEQSNIKVKDEKDIFVEKLATSPVKDVFAFVSATSTTLTNSSGFTEFDQTSSSSSFSSVGVNTTEGQQSKSQFDDEFSGNNLILNPSDFDYLLTKGNNNITVDRSSLLLKFDPLLGVPVPVIQGQQQLQQLQISTNINNNPPCLSPTLEEEDEHNDSNRSFVIDTKTGGAAGGGGGGGASAKLLLNERSSQEVVRKQLQLEQKVQQNKRQITQQTINKKNATMSVDVIKDMSLDNDCNKAFENSNSTQSDDKQINYKMDELEKKIKNEVLKTEDIEKKLKDAEQREEALIKRITEKDKTMTKMTGVIEAYEKAIAELIADKEQLTQHYEKQLAEIKSDRDSNYHHLTSLETTFSDLHVKYEKSKEMTCQLKESEEALQAEKRKNLENLHLQEQRYDKMKNHAMQQLEIANKKLESLTREHSIEITKLKALLKKEEIARSSINEQLAHKTIENAELVKICDELISGQGSNFAFEPFDPKKH